MKDNRNSGAAVNLTKFSCDTLPHLSISAGNKSGQFPMGKGLFFVSVAQILGGCLLKMKPSKYLQSGVDPNADPYHAGSGRKHRRGEVWKAFALGIYSTKCVRKCPLNFQSNLRDQEAAGSSPATPTKNLLISGEIRRFYFIFV